MHVSTLYGKLTTPNWPDDLIVRSLREHGEWGEAEAELLAPLVETGEILWDLGAFLGTFSLGLARHVPLERVLAVEVNSDLRACLKTNLDLNLPCPATVLTAGVGSHNGWIRPRNGGDCANHGARDYAVAGEDAEGGAVACHSLHSLRATHGEYDVLKIDIEGMEYDALQGDLAYLKSRQPIVWAECNENRECLKLLETLLWLGYNPVYLAFPAFRKFNFKRTSNLIYPMAYEAALLAAPPDRLARLTATVEGEDIICRPVYTAYDLRRALYDTPRWCKAEWSDMNRAELIARLGRSQLSMDIKDFLTADIPK